MKTIVFQNHVYTDKPPGHSNKRKASMSQEARELTLATENDAFIWAGEISSFRRGVHDQNPRAITYPAVVQNLVRKLASGKFDRRKSMVLWMNFTQGAARAYIQAHGTPGAQLGSIFSKSDLQQAAESFAETFEDEYNYGEHDEHIPMKYQKQNAQQGIERAPLS